MDKPFPKTWGKFVETKVKILSKEFDKNHHHGVAASGIFDCTGDSPNPYHSSYLLPTFIPQPLPMTDYRLEWKKEIENIQINNALLLLIRSCKDESKLEMDIETTIDDLAKEKAKNNNIAFQEARKKLLKENLELLYVYEAVNKYFHLRNPACRIHSKGDDLLEGESITMGVSNFLDCLFTFYNSRQDIFRLRRASVDGVISTFIPQISDDDWTPSVFPRNGWWAEIGATAHKLGTNGRFDGNDHTKLIRLAKDMLDKFLEQNINIPILLIQTDGLNFKIMVLRYDYAEFLTCGLVWHGNLDLIKFDGNKISELLASLILFRNTLQMYGEVIYKQITKAKHDRFGKNVSYVQAKTQMPDGKVAFPFETIHSKKIYGPLLLKSTIDGTLKKMNIRLFQMKSITKDLSAVVCRDMLCLCMRLCKLCVFVFIVSFTNEQC